MKKVICISQKDVCAEDFLVRVEKIFQQDIFAFILREKDLSDEAYRELALKVLSIAKNYKTPLFLNGHFKFACELGLGVQLSFQAYQELTDSPVPVGISIHSKEEAEYIMQTQKKLTVSHILAGHIFPTDCKKGLAPRGLTFLSAVCTVINKKFPVFGLGGISPEKMFALHEAGAYGGAIMSSCMKAPNIEDLLNSFDK